MEDLIILLGICVIRAFGKWFKLSCIVTWYMFYGMFALTYYSCKLIVLAGLILIRDIVVLTMAILSCIVCKIFKRKLPRLSLGRHFKLSLRWDD